MVSNKTFFSILKNKTVLVTGHTGFIGSWLTLWLNLIGSNVIGFSTKPPTKPSMFKILKLEKSITHVIGDVTNLSSFKKCIDTHKPDFVFHLAAQPLVRTSYEKPIDTINTNVMGSVNLLDCLRNQNKKTVCIIMTSDKCYDNSQQFFHKESDPMGGYDPYSASKGATELIISSYRNSFFNSNDSKNKISLASIRAGNVIGGGDWADDRLIPDCIRSLISKKPISIRNPNGIRPFQHVLEPLSGMLYLATKMWKYPNLFSESWNFGPLKKNKITVKDIISKMINLWGCGKWINLSKKNLLHESNVLLLDSSKSKKYLNWIPSYSINESLLETVTWYKSYVDNKNDMKEFSLQQINSYIIKAKKMKIDWALNT
jgi:CDP-glucose 4,6-dehydratase